MARYNEKVKLKRVNLEVTRMSLGTAALGGLFTSVSDADSEALLNTALELGLNYFDTAPLYGHGVAEVRLGKGLQNANVPYVVETKVGRILRKVEDAEIFPWFPDASREIVPIFDYSADGIRSSFEESLERMGLPHIDIVLMHDAEEYVPEAIDNAFPVLAELKSQGLIKAIGIGINHPKQALEIMKATELDIVLMAGRYTLLDQISQREFFPYALAHNIDITIGGVLNSGVLANPVAGSTFNYLPAPAEIIERAAKIGNFLQERGVPLLAAALQFPLRHPAVTSVLTGPRNTRELLENIEHFNYQLPPDIWVELENANFIEIIPEKVR